jgi:hypothetical protein
MLYWIALRIGVLFSVSVAADSCSDTISWLGGQRNIQMKGYLDQVRCSGKYRSRFIGVGEDGLEASVKL